jgi:ketosteroid isomerase-like protein
LEDSPGFRLGDMSAMLQRITEAQNAHDADVFASYFAEDYLSAQPAHPGRAFSGRAQVLANWSSVFAGVPDFRADLLALCRDGADEWGEFDWRGHHTDGTAFAMRGVIIVTIRDDQIATGRLYMEPVEDRGDDIHAAVAELFRQPPDDEA